MQKTESQSTGLRISSSFTVLSDIVRRTRFTSLTLIPLSSFAINCVVIADSGGPYIAGSSLLTIGSS